MKTVKKVTGRKNLKSSLICLWSLHNGMACIQTTNALILPPSLPYNDGEIGTVVRKYLNAQLWGGHRLKVETGIPRRGAREHPWGLSVVVANPENGCWQLSLSEALRSRQVYRQEYHEALRQWFTWSGVYLELQCGFGFDVDLDWAFLLVDWSGSTVVLTLGAPDLYPIWTAAEEE